MARSETVRASGDGHRRFIPLDGRLVRHSPGLDSFRRYLTDSPTPARIASLLKQVDQGDVAALIEITQEIESKDAHLQGVARARRQSLTSLDWDVQPNLESHDQRAAKEAADFVVRSLERIAEWGETLKHFSTAIGPGVAASELVWHRGRLVEIIDVPGDRLQSDPTGLTNRIFVRIDSDWFGIPAVQPKFAVFTPDNEAGFPQRTSIARSQAYLWVLKHVVLSDWAGFIELFGQPARVATFENDVSDSVRDQVWDMLDNMGSGLAAMFPRGVQVELKEAARASEPFSAFIEWIEKKQSIAYLGQTLTTEAGPVGSLALGRVHQDVRVSLTLDDIKNEADFIEQQIFRWMVRFRWPTLDIPIPRFVRNIIEEKSFDEDRIILDRLRFAKEMGLPIDPEDAYELLRLPVPKSRA